MLGYTNKQIFAEKCWIVTVIKTKTEGGAGLLQLAEYNKNKYLQTKLHKTMKKCWI